MPHYRVPLRPVPDDGKVRAGSHVRLIDPSAYWRETNYAATGTAMKVGRSRTSVRWTSGRICSVPTRELRVIR